MKGYVFAWPAIGFFLGVSAALMPSKTPLPLTAGVAALSLQMILVPLLSRTLTAARAATVFAGLFLALPCYIEASPIARCLLACFCAVPFIAAVALLSALPTGSFNNRLAFLCSWCGTQNLQRRARAFDKAALMKLLFATAVLALAIAVVKIASGSVAGMPLRWFAGGIAILAFAEMATAALPLVAGTVGVVVPPLFKSPHLSISISEFWTRRWNILTSQLLRNFCFLPLSRHGAASAMIATFLLSGVAHMMLAFLVLGRWPISLLCGTFFFVQPLLIAAERRFGIRRRRPAVARVWTLAVLTLTSPLIVEPTLQVVEGGWYEPNTIFHAILAAFTFVVMLSTLISVASLMSGLKCSRARFD